MEGNVSPVEISNCSGASRPDLKEINALLATSFRGAVAARVRDAQREGDVATWRRRAVQPCLAGTREQREYSPLFGVHLENPGFISYNCAPASLSNPYATSDT